MTNVVTAGDLKVAFEEWGAGDRPVLFLHGFPDDASTWRGVAERLPSGVRAIAPYVRGFGPTRFRSPETIRTGQLAAQVADVVAFIDALGLDHVVVVGHDWGQRTAQALAALYPSRVRHLVSLGDYALTFDRSQRPPLRQLWAFRFHILMNTPLGARTLSNPERLARRLWRRWSPQALWDEAAFQTMVPSLENPDFRAIVLSAYRQMSGKGARDPKYQQLEQALGKGPAVAVPTTVVRATRDGLDLFDAHKPLSTKFAAVHRTVDVGTGHWPQRESPQLIAELVTEVV